MQLSPKQLSAFGFSGFVLSLLVHLLALSRLYLVSNITVGVLTLGMLAAWLIPSRMIKEQFRTEESPWKMIFTRTPFWLRYGFYFILVYALVNALFTLPIRTGGTYVDLEITTAKIRLLSGFWLLFYAFAFITGAALRGTEE